MLQLSVSRQQKDLVFHSYINSDEELVDEMINLIVIYSQQIVMSDRGSKLWNKQMIDLNYQKWIWNSDDLEKFME